MNLALFIFEVLGPVDDMPASELGSYRDKKAKDLSEAELRQLDTH